jgi:L-asparaginase/Glu-tRNA(Gln) amidotransferase subunit D
MEQFKAGMARLAAYAASNVGPNPKDLDQLLATGDSNLIKGIFFASTGKGRLPPALSKQIRKLKDRGYAKKKRTAPKARNKQLEAENQKLRRQLDATKLLNATQLNEIRSLRRQAQAQAQASSLMDTAPLGARAHPKRLPTLPKSF